MLTACLSLNSLCALGLSQTVLTLFFFFLACLSASSYTRDEQVAASPQTPAQKLWAGGGPRRKMKADTMPHLHSRWWITIRMDTHVLVRLWIGVVALKNQCYSKRWRRRWLSCTHHSCLRRSSVSATEILVSADAMHLDASLKHLLDCRWVNLICSAVYWWKSPGADKAWVAVAAKTDDGLGEAFSSAS